MNAESEFERLAAMLPFYVNGTLEEDGRRQVEVALAFSPELSALLEEERALADAVVSDTQMGMANVQDDGEVRLSQMMAGLPEQGGSGGTSGGAQSGDAASGGALANALSFLSPRRWNPTVVLGAGVLGLGGVTGWQATMIDRLEAENYELLSGQDGTAQGIILVEFSADAQWDAILTLMEEEGLTIVSASAFGAVTLGGETAEDGVAEQVERLRASPLIATADPAA